MFRKSATLLLALFLAFSTLLASRATPAFAHAVLLWTDPQDGKTLTDAPRQVHLWFSEPVLLDFTRVELLDADNKAFPLPAARLDTETMAQLAANGEKKMVLVADLPALSPNAYRLNWQTRSGDDLHVIGGSVFFGIQRPVSRGTDNSKAAETQPDEALWRGLSFMGLAGLTGALSLALLALPRLRRKADRAEKEALIEQIQGRFLRFGFWAGMAALLAGCGLLLFEGLNGAAWGLILSRTAYGLRWLLGQVTLVGLLAALFFRLRSRLFQGRAATALLVGLNLLLLAIQAQNSHSAGSDTFSLLTATVDGLHLWGAAFWAGGLLSLLPVIVPLLRKEAHSRDLAWAMLQSFGPLAAFSLLILAATGLYKSGQQVASLDALLTTLYGQALLLKVQLALFAALVGLGSSALLHPSVARLLGILVRRPAGWKPFSVKHLRRALMVETVAAGLLLFLAAFLTATQLARGPEFDPPVVTAQSAASTYSTQVNDLQLALSVKPNRPGQNFWNISVFNTRRPAPAPFDNVVVQLVSKSEPSKTFNVNATPLGNGRYQVAGNYFDSAGDWEITVRVNRPGLEEARLTTGWKVLPAQDLDPKRPVFFSNQPLAPILNLVALALVATASVAFGLYLLRRNNLTYPRLKRPSLRLRTIIEQENGE